MTPYAVLLIDHQSSDVEVRRAFYALIKHHHPDSSGVEGTADQEWFRLNAAYKLVKTEADRAAWWRRQSLLSRLCAGCAGLGVQRLKGTTTMCPGCGGEGRNEKGL